ncbi:hypothetical protein [Sinorhizobium mexicanum]|uniref:Uncharacterized protein n=1 Tax=Sinorhizobium mexicanum TaxID=375549 RepID=A0A859R655_9HYPH|nr:hypothetical protein [Sinorhizobium mexicanum]MBP1884322.1 hypothetical protein [Sinorhizobium mexicanum]QLL65008.1 hypothetical protein FKV68_26935 [Sinorhizobium mexicanum]
MADADKMKRLIEDCRKDIAAYLPPDSALAPEELLNRLLCRLDGRQAKEALCDDWQGWCPADGEGDGDVDRAGQSAPEIA